MKVLARVSLVVLGVALMLAGGYAFSVVDAKALADLAYPSCTQYNGECAPGYIQQAILCASAVILGALAAVGGLFVPSARR